jgi:hypothetical protein
MENVSVARESAPGRWVYGVFKLLRIVLEGTKIKGKLGVQCRLPEELKMEIPPQAMTCVL